MASLLFNNTERTYRAQELLTLIRGLQTEIETTQKQLEEMVGKNLTRMRSILQDWHITTDEQLLKSLEAHVPEKRLLEIQEEIQRLKGTGVLENLFLLGLSLASFLSVAGQGLKIANMVVQSCATPAVAFSACANSISICSGTTGLLHGSTSSLTFGSKTTKFFKFMRRAGVVMAVVDLGLLVADIAVEASNIPKQKDLITELYFLRFFTQSVSIDLRTVHNYQAQFNGVLKILHTIPDTSSQAAVIESSIKGFNQIEATNYEPIWDAVRIADQVSIYKDDDPSKEATEQFMGDKRLYNASG